MNRKVKAKLKEIDSRLGLFIFRVRVYRPFITATIIDGQGNEHGIGTACVQLPDKWDVGRGTKAAKTRAVKHMLGIPNPRIVNLIANEVSQQT